jgi:NhaA family Na+:H+ antiporter
VGVAGAGSLAIRLGVGRRPAGTNGLHLLGVGIVAGLGFTMSIFVTLLAFDSPQLVDESKIGVFGASIVAAALGLTTLWFAAQRATPRSPELGPASASST